MTYRNLFIFLGVALLIGCARSGTGYMQSAADSVIVEQLRAADADLAQETELSVYLYLNTEADAIEVANQARGLGFSGAQIFVNAGDGWTYIGTRRMVPELAVMRDLSRQLELLASAHGGRYGGWSAAVLAPSL